MRSPLSYNSINAMPSPNSVTTPSTYATKPPFKRRRIAAPPPAAHMITIPSVNGLQQPGVVKGNLVHTSCRPVGVQQQNCCVSCHRSLLGMPGGPVVCARCESLSCRICSRRCTSGGFVKTSPPPPSRGRTGTPSERSESPNNSDLPTRRRRSSSMIDLDDENESANVDVETKRAGRRRKASSPDRDDDRNGSYDEERGGAEGCGRTVCRSCCFEDVERDTSTCLDCCSSAC
ncbi:hypothetical protein DFP72DRAFT_1170101 [Ephemerocybe angulata]|uniref:Uncharacterized protein n=1 Tax=Ephemerocybe angulata TaxID=980116 RepID=A0A8H6HX25_9AGAR|nr:hypothetical protein DFP72DRAFT_1170101 [Tulosesus angulatus]